MSTSIRRCNRGRREKMPRQPVRIPGFALVVLAGTMFAAPPTAVADNDADAAMTVTTEMREEADDFLENSPLVKRMRRDNEPNLPVRPNDMWADGLIMSNDLVACLHLTNPDVPYEVDSGGGFNLDLRKVTFPGGTWDVHLRIRELERIDKLDKTTVLVLDRLVIGTLRMVGQEQISKAVRLLTKACF